MRVVVASVVLAGLAAPALAQQQGSFVLDAMTTPGRHFGFGYYLTDNLSLRPALGAGYAEGYGLLFNAGADLRYELLAGHRVSPYAAAGINYMRNPTLVRYDAAGVLRGDTGADALRYGAGAGFRVRLKYGLAFVAEGRLMNSRLRSTFAGPSIREGAYFEAAAGVSYSLN